MRPLREQSPNLSPFSSLTRPSADVPEDFRSPIYVGRSIKRYKVQTSLSPHFIAFFLCLLYCLFLSLQSDGDSLNGNRKQEARGIIGTPLAVRDRKHENIQTEKYIEKVKNKVELLRFVFTENLRLISSSLSSSRRFNQADLYSFNLHSPNP